MAMADLSPIQIIGGAIGGGGVSAFFGWLTQRGKQSSYVQGQVDRAMENALEGVSQQLKRADDRIQAVEDREVKCQEDLQDVRRRLEESELDRAELRREITALMAGPPATYDAKAMKRVGDG